MLYVVTLPHAEHIMQNAGLDESPAEIKIVGRNINNLNHAVTIRYHPNGRKQRGTKEPLDEGKRVKASLKFNIQKTKNMASGVITSWQIEGGKVERVIDFIFLGSRIIADGDCSHEIKRHLLLGRKAMTNLETVLKSRDITLPT